MPVLSRSVFFAVLLGFFITGAHAQILDDFTESQGPVVDTTDGDGPVTDTGAFGPLGSRTLSADKAAGPTGNAARLEVIGGSSVLSYSQDAGVTGTAIVTWTGGPADLTAGGADTLELVVNENQEAVPIVVRVGDGTATATFNATVPEIPPAGSSVTIPLDQFAGVDLTAVTLLELEIQGTSDGDDILIESIGLLDNIAPGVAILKTATLIDPDDCLSPGDVIEYTVTVTNTGDGFLTQVNVEDTLPAEVSLTGVAVLGTNDAEIVTFTSGETVGDAAVNYGIQRLPEGGTVVVTFQATINVGVAPTTVIDNIASITQADALNQLPSDNAPVVTQNCDIPPPVGIPTLSQWSMLLLGGILVLLGWTARRRGLLD